MASENRLAQSRRVCVCCIGKSQNLFPTGCMRAAPRVLFWPRRSCYVLVTCQPRTEVRRTKWPHRSFLSQRVVTRWHRPMNSRADTDSSTSWSDGVPIELWRTSAFMHSVHLFPPSPLCASVNSCHGILNVTRASPLADWICRFPRMPKVLGNGRRPPAESVLTCLGFSRLTGNKEKNKLSVFFPWGAKYDLALLQLHWELKCH